MARKYIPLSGARGGVDWRNSYDFVELSIIVFGENFVPVLGCSGASFGGLNSRAPRAGWG